MAIIAPMAIWKPFTGKSQNALTYDIVCAHTMVGTLAGSWDWANQAGNPYWHFGLGGNGDLWQCVDLQFRSASNLEGNHHVIPIETEDKGSSFPGWSGSDVPAWTDAQVDKLVEVCVWLCKRFDIPAVLVPDTKPGRRGLAYHRQGIDPWRVSGGEKWSNATGKVCPGDRRVAQFRDVVVPRVAAGVIEPQPEPEPPPEEEDDDMKDLIIRADGKSPIWLRGETVIPLVHASSINNLKENGDVVEKTITPTDYDSVVRELEAPELTDAVETPNP